VPLLLRRLINFCLLLLLWLKLLNLTLLRPRRLLSILRLLLLALEAVPTDRNTVGLPRREERATTFKV